MGADVSFRMRSEPLFFPSHGRPLFGMFCQPVAKGLSPVALVACHSVGLEHAVTSRMLALGARRAAALGYPALLYHSRGHGDSGGDFADVTFESLLEDALCAGAHARERSGASRIVWLGLRFGSLIAAEAAAQCRDTAALVLWEPVHRGADYFRQFVRGLLFAAVARGTRSGTTVNEVLERVEREGRVDIHASYLHAMLYRSTRGIDLAQSLREWSGPTFIGQVQPRLNLSAENAALVTALKGRNAKVGVTLIREDPGWQFPLWRVPWTSTALLDETGAWLDELA